MIAPASETEKPGATAPLALWLIIQLAVLALVVARLPLAAQFPAASERLAPTFMLAAQVVAGAMLFPFLLSHVRLAVQIVLSAIPFQLAAASLAGLELKSILPAALFVELWLVALALWAMGLRHQQTRLLGVAIAVSLTLGAGAVEYLRMEFNPNSSASRTPVSALPLPATWVVLSGSRAIAGWAFSASLIVGGLVLLLFHRHRTSRVSRHVPEIS